MKNLLGIFLLVISFSSSAGEFGEVKKEDVSSRDFLMKSFIKANEKVLSERVQRYNKEGLRWLQEQTKSKEDKDLIKTLVERTRTRHLNPIRVRGDYFVVNVYDVEIRFSSSDILFDRIYVNNEVFNLKRKESLPEFQDRFLKFVSKNPNKKTSLLSLLMNEAHADTTSITRVQSMVVLNATGVVSISYDEPWFWQMGQYSADLAAYFANQIDWAYWECQTKAHAMYGDEETKISDDMKKILDSMKVGGEYTYEKLTSSLLKKYSVNNKIDRETTGKRGRYIPLSGSCTKIDPKNPGLIQQMFPKSDYAPVLTGDTYENWVNGNAHKNGNFSARNGVCDALSKTISCLENLEAVSERHVNNSNPDQLKEISFREGTVYDEVNGSHTSSK